MYETPKTLASPQEDQIIVNQVIEVQIIEDQIREDKIREVPLCNGQCWASYFVKVTSYILHITCNRTI